MSRVAHLDNTNASDSDRVKRAKCGQLTRTHVGADESLQTPAAKSFASKVPLYFFVILGTSVLYYVGYKAISQFWASRTGQRTMFFTKWY